MEKQREDPEGWPIWIDREKRIVSFQETAGFEKLEYSTHDEMFRFAIEKTAEGYAIQ